MDNEQLTVVYEEHKSSMVNTLRDLLESNSLVDCVLAAEGQCLKAHRIILATSSPYFKMLFSQDSERLPIVHLQDVEYEHLKMIINFIYCGEVKVKNSQFESFLEVAKSLQIKGLDGRGRTNNSELQNSKSPELQQKESLVCISSVSTVTNEEWAREESEEEEVENMGGEEERNDADSEARNEITLLEDNDSLDDLSCSAGSEIYCESIVEVTNQSPSSTNEITPSSRATKPDFTDDLKDCVRMSSKGGKGYAIVYSPKVVMEDFSEVFQDLGFGIERTIIGVLPDSVENTKSSNIFKLALPCNDKDREDNPRDLSLQKRRNDALGHPPVRCKEHVRTQDPSLLGGPGRSQTSATQHLACSVCNKSVVSKSQLRMHMRTHPGDKPYSCSMCPRKFKRKGNLISHMRKHTGEKPFVCSICDKRFSFKGVLKMHMIQHTGEKPHSCTMCPLKFTAKGNLISHMRKHTGERPYVCSICEKRFSLMMYLKRHMRQHTGKNHINAPNAHRRTQLNGTLPRT